MITLDAGQIWESTIPGFIGFIEIIRKPAEDAEPLILAWIEQHNARLRHD